MKLHMFVLHIMTCTYVPPGLQLLVHVRYMYLMKVYNYILHVLDINYRNTRYRYLLKLKTCNSVFINLFDVVMTTTVHVFLKDLFYCVYTNSE